MIPDGARYYSAFPLGAVLSMLPVALLQKASLIHDFPARILGALIAGACVYFFFNSRKHLDPTIPPSNQNDSLGEFCLRCSRYLEPGPGVTSGWAVPGKSLLASRYWAKPQLSILRWCDRRPSSRGRSSLLLSEIGPSLSSQPLSSFIFSGAAPCLQRRRLACR